MSALFDSFLLAGFECTTGYNMYGAWIDPFHSDWGSTGSYN